jgi:hypothetical protein
MSWLVIAMMLQPSIASRQAKYLTKFQRSRRTVSVQETRVFAPLHSLPEKTSTNGQ